MREKKSGEECTHLIPRIPIKHTLRLSKDSGILPCQARRNDARRPPSYLAILPFKLEAKDILLLPGPGDIERKVGHALDAHADLHRWWV